MNTSYTTTSTTNQTSYANFNIGFINHLPPEEPGAAACATLGVPPKTPPGGIRAAYRARVKETHPDVGGDRTAFEVVQRAFEELQRIGRA